MQIDFHFGMIYVLCRAVGIKPEISFNIARASQYVDDNRDKNPIKIEGRVVTPLVTSYDPVDVRNFTFEEGWRVWAPFHFLPAGEGKNLSERLICRPDSDSVKVTIKCYKNSRKNFLNEQYLGIILHVIADTYSHQGFSGFLSELNGIGDVENIEPKNHKFSNPILDRIIIKLNTDIEKLFRVGHALVGYRPDVPFLKWKYKPYGKHKWTKVNNPSRVYKALKKCFDIIVDAVHSLENSQDILERQSIDFTVVDKLFNEVKEFNKNRISKDDRLNYLYELMERNYFNCTPEGIYKKYRENSNHPFEGESNKLAEWHISAKLHQSCVYNKVYKKIEINFLENDISN